MYRRRPFCAKRTADHQQNSEPTLCFGTTGPRGPSPGACHLSCAGYVIVRHKNWISAYLTTLVCGWVMCSARFTYVSVDRDKTWPPRSAVIHVLSYLHYANRSFRAFVFGREAWRTSSLVDDKISVRQPPTTSRSGSLELYMNLTTSSFYQ